MSKLQSHNPWDIALSFHLKRFSTATKRMEALDPGVNFFILALEMMGVKTIYSCEGHPHGFYILFETSTVMARNIQQAGYFDIMVEKGGSNLWSLRLLSQERTGVWDEAVRQHILRDAATSWVKTFPRLAVMGEVTEREGEMIRVGFKARQETQVASRLPIAA